MRETKIGGIHVPVNTLSRFAIDDLRGWEREGGGEGRGIRHPRHMAASHGSLHFPSLLPLRSLFPISLVLQPRSESFRLPPSRLLLFPYYSRKLSYLFTYAASLGRVRSRVRAIPVCLRRYYFIFRQPRRPGTNGHGGHRGWSLPSDHNGGITLFTGARPPPGRLGCEIKAAFIYRCLTAVPVDR